MGMGMGMGRWVMGVTVVHYQRLAQVREENKVTCSSASMVSDTEHGQSEYLDSCLLLRVLPHRAEIRVEDLEKFLRTLQTRLGWRWVCHPLDHGCRFGRRHGLVLLYCGRGRHIVRAWVKVRTI